jgi:hypothetical protein
VNDDLEVVDDDGSGEEPSISEPGKLMRIALMLREMQEEVRRADMDAAGRERLRIVHDRALDQLKSVLSDDLNDELDTLTFPFDADTPTESEIRVAQAQLIGWLEGLFQGIQAAIMNQQLAARQQLEQMRQRGLPPGMMPGAQGGPGQPGQPDQQVQGGRPRSPGQYL